MIYSEIGQIECDCKTEKIRAGESAICQPVMVLDMTAASDSMLYFSNPK